MEAPPTRRPSRAALRAALAAPYGGRYEEAPARRRGPVCRAASAASVVVQGHAPPGRCPLVPPVEASTASIRRRRCTPIGRAGRALPCRTGCRCARSSTVLRWPRRYRACAGGAACGAAPLLQPQLPHDHLPPGPSVVLAPQLGQFAFMVITSDMKIPAPGWGRAVIRPGVPWRTPGSRSTRSDRTPGWARQGPPCRPSRRWCRRQVGRRRRSFQGWSKWT